MPESDGVDYEILPRSEIEQLRREISAIKRSPQNSAGGQNVNSAELYNSINRLNASINKLITILEDAQQDIIAEYQNSKPAEKINQLLDQNETIAKAMISINENLKSSGVQTLSDNNSGDFPPLDMSNGQNQGQFFAPSNTDFGQNVSMPNQNSQFMGQQRVQTNNMNLMPPPTAQPIGPFNQQNNYVNPMAQGQNPQFRNMPPPPLDNSMTNMPPPLNSNDPNVLPEHKKKKFLGIM